MQIEPIKNNQLRTAYIGTYTKKEGHVDGQAEGIYVVYQNPENGTLEFGKTAANITNPSFVRTSADKKNLYAVSELGPGDDESGYIHSFRVKEDKSLEEIGKISTEGFAPCYIAEDNSGKFVFVTNYVGGVVMMYKKLQDGSLEKIQNITLENPEESHPHSLLISSDNKRAYIADLGNDRIWIFNFYIEAEAEALVPHKQPYITLKKGAGPRHLAFSGNENYAYSINELNSTVSIFRITENGGLEEVQVISSLPDDFKKENSAADIHVHPSGKFLFISNRGHNSIASFDINEGTGKLSNPVFTSTRGEAPRNFAIAPGGEFLYVANQNSNKLVTFKLDPQSGALIYLEKELEVKTPVCVEFAG